MFSDLSILAAVLVTMLIEFVLIQLIYSLKTKTTCFLTDKQVKAELRLTEEKWSSQLYDKSSEEYKTLAAQVKTSVCILESVFG